MDYLWSPWRYQYVTGGAQSNGCIFCLKASDDKDAEQYVIHRAKWNFVLLNLYPYTAGHLMVAPYQHVAVLEETPVETLSEMMYLARQAAKHLGTLYRPEGLNIGMNLGKCAGAGVAGHIHMHIVPRWTGDSSFMTTVGETRMLPEDLQITYEKLSKAFQADPVLASRR